MASSKKIFLENTKSVSWGVITGGLKRASATTVSLLAGAYHVIERAVNLIAESSPVTVSGAAGWRYIVLTNAGVVSIETIPVAEIIANTQLYTPAPVFNGVYAGYYSTINTTKRIIGILYWDASVIQEIISYGSGLEKNDDFHHVYTSTSRGSTNTNVRRFDNIAKVWGTALTFAQSATLGDSWTIVDPGYYYFEFISHLVQGFLNEMSVVINSISNEISELAIPVIVFSGIGGAINEDNRLTAGGFHYLKAGDVLRVVSPANDASSGHALKIMKRNSR